MPKESKRASKVDDKASQESDDTNMALKVGQVCETVGKFCFLCNMLSADVWSGHCSDSEDM